MTEIPASVRNIATLIDLNRYISGIQEPSLVLDRAVIEYMILNILQTEKGTYPFEPAFGVNLEKYLFRLNNVQTEASIQNEVQDAVTQWMPYVRVGPNNIRVTRVGETSIVLAINTRIDDNAEVFQFQLAA